MEGSDTIEITGQTTRTSEDVVFTVTAPNGNLVSVDQVSPDSSGDFATDISVGGPLWSQDGAYTVTAQQGSGNSNFIDSVEVDIADGLVVPEFGTIAAMILAVAIISIIAISAKSRLSIVPRY
jgi:predicted secreted protein with PEFG-CTERM motif